MEGFSRHRFGFGLGLTTDQDPTSNGIETYDRYTNRGNICIYIYIQYTYIQI